MDSFITLGTKSKLVTFFVDAGQRIIVKDFPSREIRLKATYVCLVEVRESKETRLYSAQRQELVFVALRFG